MDSTKSSGSRIKTAASILLFTLLITTAQAQLTVQTSVDKDTLYPTEKALITVEVKNQLSEQTYKNLILEVQNEELGVDENFSTSSLAPGDSWEVQVDVKTLKDTEQGNYTVNGELFYDSIHTEIVPVEIQVKENPLQVNMEFSKETMDTEENNSLSIEISNTGKKTIENIQVSPKFSKLFYIETQGKCGREIDKLRPEESFTMNCEFKANRDASGEYTLNVKTSFEDSVGQHNFDYYKGIKIKHSFSLPQVETILIGVVVLLAVLFFLRRYL